MEHWSGLFHMAYTKPQVISWLNSRGLSWNLNGCKLEQLYCSCPKAPEEMDCTSVKAPMQQSIAQIPSLLFWRLHGNPPSTLPVEDLTGKKLKWYYSNSSFISVVKEERFGKKEWCDSNREMRGWPLVLCFTQQTVTDQQYCLKIRERRIPDCVLLFLYNYIQIDVPQAFT